MWIVVEGKEEYNNDVLGMRFALFFFFFKSYKTRAVEIPANLYKTFGFILLYIVVVLWNFLSENYSWIVTKGINT